MVNVIVKLLPSMVWLGPERLYTGSIEVSLIVTWAKALLLFSNKVNTSPPSVMLSSVTLKVAVATPLSPASTGPIVKLPVKASAISLAFIPGSPRAGLAISIL